MQPTLRRWTLKADVPLDEAPIVSDAIEPFAESLNLFEADPDGTIWSIQAVLREGFDRETLLDAVSLAAAANGIEEPRVTMQPLQEEDWLRRVQADFPPFRLGRIFLHGSHYRPGRGDGPIRLQVDAGTAFGSGEHPTTQGCLLALQDLRKHWRARRVLDMGCGSGILSLAAANLWNCKVTAVDIDAEAVRVTRANAKLNGVANELRAGAGNGYAAPILARAAPFDLVASNILARPLRRMAPELSRVLEPGGYAVLSGLLRRQQAGVLAAHRSQGLRLVRRYPIGEWQTLVLRK